MVYLCGRPLANRGRCTLGRETAIQPMTWGAGWLAAHDRRRGHSRRGRAGAARSDAAAASAAAGSRGLRRRHAADRVSVAALAVAGQVVQPARTEGSSAPLRPRDDRQPVSSRRSSRVGSRRTASARRPRGVRAGALPADGRSRLLLQQRQVPLLLRVARRHDRQAPASDVGAARSGQPDAFTPPIPIADGGRSSCASKWTTSGCSSRIALGGRRVAMAAAAVRRQHSLRRSQRAGPAELHRRVRRHGVSGSRRHGEAG